MKKADLVDAIAGKSGAPKAQVQQLVEDVFELMADALSRGDKIDLRGFGTFSVRESAARTGRNPQTGEPIQIPARKTPGSSRARSSRTASTTRAKRPPRADAALLARPRSRLPPYSVNPIPSERLAADARPRRPDRARDEVAVQVHRRRHHQHHAHLPGGTPRPRAMVLTSDCDGPMPAKPVTA